MCGQHMGDVKRGLESTDFTMFDGLGCHVTHRATEPGLSKDPYWQRVMVRKCLDGIDKSSHQDRLMRKLLDVKDC
jgi:hypothetical protein